MRIKKYGIELKRLTENELEQVRSWRNADHVRLNMAYQEIISTEQQQAWFKQLDVNRNYYFLIQSDDKALGVVNLKDIDLEAKTAEAGIFIGETEYLNTLTPILATVAIMEFAFEELELKALKAKIARDNEKAILFNKRLGYVKAKEDLESDYEYYTTTQALFKVATESIRPVLQKLNTQFFKD